MKAAHFPPGDTRCDEIDAETSLWRETSFALHLVRQAVNPRLELAKCVEQWGEISKNLAESPRKRMKQLRRLALAK